MSSTQTTRSVMPCGCCVFPKIHNENSVCDIIDHLRKAGTNNEVLAMCIVATLGKKESFELVRHILAELEPEVEPIDEDAY